MYSSEIQNCYYDWLVNKVFKYTNERDEYSLLMTKLHETEYIYSLEKDANRYDDGLDLKKTFCWEVGIGLQTAEILGTQCSILEMMVALASRCEVSIMSDPSKGNRTGLWFMTMLKSMHLDSQTNDVYNESYVENRLRIMLYRNYDEYGDGALFKVNDPVYDMREAEVWMQMNWYLSELI